MKDYTRLTRQSVDNFKYCLKDHKAKIGEFNDYDAFFDYSMAVKRLGELEDKIERGELISTKETGDTEIEFFVKHNDRVRKFALKNFAKVLKEKEQSVKIANEWKAVVTDEDIDEFVKEVCGDD